MIREKDNGYTNQSCGSAGSNPTVDGTIVFFNEAEVVCNLDAPEPDDLELKAPKKKKQAGKKQRIPPVFLSIG